jgi:E3 ubiquitin-protein ligase XIAP
MDTSASPLLYYNMKKEADRLRTYDSWPVSFMDKNYMAAAGFYFVGSEDRVRCPFCGVQVGCWAPGDDPFSERKRWSQSCGFFKGYFTGNFPIGSDALQDVAVNINT